VSVFDCIVADKKTLETATVSAVFVRFEPWVIYKQTVAAFVNIYIHGLERT
jgi:hypothetical protein